MRVQAKIADSFSPYLDPAPFFDALEDKRGAFAAGSALLLHTIFFITLSMTVLLPPPKILEPEVIPIRIVMAQAEDPAPAQPSPEPEPAKVTPAAPTPRPRPTPKPQTAPPPPPVQAQLPEPLPEIIETPQPIPAPPPPVLADAAPAEPDESAVSEPLVSDEVRAAAVAALQERLEAQNRPVEPEPLPIVEAPPEIIQEVIPEIVPEIVPEIIPEIIPEIVLDPIVEPEPFLEPEPYVPETPVEPEPQIEIVEPAPEPLPETPDFVVDAPLPETEIIPDAAPGAIIDTPVFEPEPLPVTPDPIVEPEIDTPVETAPDLEPEIIDTAPVITAAPPKVLADTAAPETAAEKERAVDKSQASTGETPSQPSGGGGRTYTTPTFGGGGGPVPSGVPPASGAPSRPALGAGGWSLSPSTPGDAPTGGLGGVSLDMRCRDLNKTHEDCPEYVRKNQGRSADGTEGFGAHSIAGSGRGAPRQTRQVGGENNQLGYDFSQHNNGGPSTTVLDDADFGRTFRSNPIVVGRPQGDLQGFIDSASPFVKPDIVLDPEELEDEKVKDPWSLKGDN